MFNIFRRIKNQAKPGLFLWIHVLAILKCCDKITKTYQKEMNVGDKRHKVLGSAKKWNSKTKRLGFNI